MKKLLGQVCSVALFAFVVVGLIFFCRTVYQVGEIARMTAENIRLETAIIRQETANMRAEFELRQAAIAESKTAD